VVVNIRWEEGVNSRKMTYRTFGFPSFDKVDKEKVV
jgi:hypothetical protein